MHTYTCKCNSNSRTVKRGESGQFEHCFDCSFFPVASIATVFAAFYVHILDLHASNVKFSGFRVLHPLFLKKVAVPIHLKFGVNRDIVNAM